MSNRTARRPSGVARITRLALASWRNFQHVDIALGQRVFVVGPNAAGKTNLLDAIRFLHDIATPGGSVVRAVDDRRGLKHIRSLHARKQSNVMVRVRISVGEDPCEWEYELELSGTESRRKKPLRVEREVVRHGGDEIIRRPKTGESDLELTQTYLEQVSRSLEFRPLAEALASVVHVHVVPQVARSVARAEEFARRDAPGSDFIDQIARLPRSRQDAALKRIARLLKRAVPKFSELRSERDDIGRPHLVANYRNWRHHGAWQNEQEFSDGTLRLIGLLWAVDQGVAPLLLEEPELSLHRDIIKQLPRLMSLASARTGRQVIISTHATEEILGDRGIEPAEILVLDVSEDATTVTPGSHIKELVALAGVGEALGPLVSAMTRPKDVEQLVMPLGR